jgi:hypothetical protein
MASIPITRVRHTDEQSRELLSTFVFEGRYGGSRVPRGIDPRFVSRFILEGLQPGSEAGAYAAVLEVIRFYERADVLVHIRRALSTHEASGEDVMRSAYVLQAIGDLGSSDDALQAADYFNRILVPHPYVVTTLYTVLFETLVVLAPAGSPNRLLERLTQELRTLEPGRHAGEAGLMKYDALAAVHANEVPKTTVLIEIKNRLTAQLPEARRAELVRIYLGLSTGGAILGTWAARLLRKEAMEGAPDPVYAEFGRAIDSVDVTKLGEERGNFIKERAAQAILYLQGTLRPRHHVAMSGRPNFLSDQ